MIEAQAFELALLSWAKDMFNRSDIEKVQIEIDSDYYRYSDVPELSLEVSALRLKKNTRDTWVSLETRYLEANVENLMQNFFEFVRKGENLHG